MDEQEDLDTPDEATEEAPDEPMLDEHDIFENYDIITIALDRSSQDLPELDLGHTSPWAAIALLRSAISTLEMLVPPLDVRYRGDMILRQVHHSEEFEIVDTDSLDFDDDDDA